MTAARARGIDDEPTAPLPLRTAEGLQAYWQRGRRHVRLTNEELLALWTASFEAVIARNTAETRQDYEDSNYEMTIRHLRPNLRVIEAVWERWITSIHNRI